MTTAYPLRWPEGWPKTPSDKRSRGYQFKRTGNYLPTFAHGREGLLAELDRLGARNIVISSSIDVRADGAPRQGVDPDRFTLRDPGVAVYFYLNNRQMVMAQDAYDSPGVNLRSLTLAVEAMRALERHGGGTMMSKAFDGFAALPPPANARPKRPWWQVLGYPADPTERPYLSVPEVEARFRAMAKKLHPDAGGDSAGMADLAAARDEAVAELNGGDE